MLVDLQANIVELIQDSSVMIDDHYKGVMAKNILRKVMRRWKQQKMKTGVAMNNQPRNRL